MKTIAAIAALTAIVASATAASAKDTTRSVDGRPLIMVGEGALVVDGATLYDMQLWIDEEDAKRAFPALAMRASGRDKAHLTRGEHGPNFLVWGRFTKQALFKFAHAVSAETMREEVRSHLGNEKGADDVAALFAHDAAAGDEWVLTTGDNGEIALDVGGKHGKKVGPQSPKLERALWDVWLGVRPLSVDLRQALLSHLDLLGR